MRNLITFLFLLTILLAAQTAFAQCPDMNGFWTTANGTMSGGRASEAWCGADGAPVQPGVPGNTQNAMSWNGTVLGGQWQAWGMQIDAVGAVLVSDDLDGFGNGSQTYRTSYDGGFFWLTRDHTWADGLADLDGEMTSFVVFTTITFFGGVPVGATSNITFEGAFLNCPSANNCLIRFAIANAMKVWDSGAGGTAPANYPPFLCGASAGELFDVCCISLDINCAVPTEKRSFGTVKAIFK